MLRLSIFYWIDGDLPFFHIDMAVRNSDLAHCMFKAYEETHSVSRHRLFWPRTFRWLGHLCKHAFMGPELRNDFLNFDLAAFVRNAIDAGDIERREIIHFAYDWVDIICNAGLEERDKQFTLNRCNNYLKSQLQPYQSDSRLQLLVVLVAFSNKIENSFEIWRLTCRMKDILLGLDDHNVHLKDRDALDLRHVDQCDLPIDVFQNFRLNGDGYASLALLCLRFLADPLTYLERRNIFDSGTEWNSIILSYLILLHFLLLEADPIPELSQFVADHDIHQVIKEKMPALVVWNTGLHILAFLSRANVCVNWRIVVAIQLGPIAFNDNDDELLDDVATFWSSGTCSGNDPCCPESEEDLQWESGEGDVREPLESPMALDTWWDMMGLRDTYTLQDLMEDV